jgi:N6-adenosine-specific RNA methylase IME4/Trp operon repressor
VSRQDNSKPTIDLLLATKAVVERDLRLGLVIEDQLRFTVEARKQIARKLSDEGLSTREIAEVTGASFNTIARDLRVSDDTESVSNDTLTKSERRAEKETALAAKQAALPTKRYGVILADPEWRFEPWSRETGMDRAADNHYPTSPTEIIAQRDVPSIAADDCVLFLWATVPMLPAALEVMRAWGFEYKSHMMWDKIHIGTGYWFRNRHELLLVGIKGDVPAPAMGEQYPSVMQIGRGAHSAKPDHFLEMIETYFPKLSKIELNRRGEPRPGWDAWGNESNAA